MKSVITIVCLLALICSLEARPSYYYSNKNSDGYHPPYDFYTPESSDYSSESQNCAATCDPINSVTVANPNYTMSTNSRCVNLPDFMTNAQTPFASSLNFDSCCVDYESCLQNCLGSKSYCDQQFYGCMWSGCGYSFRVRPGDRVMCRRYASCYASYLTNNVTCERYTYIQQQACTCEFGGSTVPFPSSSPSPNVVSSLEGSSSSQESSSPAVPSPSASPVVKRDIEHRQNVNNFTETQPVSMESSSSNMESSYSSIGSNNNVEGSSDGVVYRGRVVPGWGVIGSQCTADGLQGGNFINVMSDQEMDDINFYQQN